MTEPTLTLEQKAALLSGDGTWSTQDVSSPAIGQVKLSDGPHGLRAQEGEGDNLGINDSLPATCFPPAVAVGSSWDPRVAERLASAIALEARSFGVGVVLGPGVNIKRSPLCGRNFEYYSEDPLVSGVLGAAHVRGLQANGVGASLKHFAANNQETDRMRVDAVVDERTLREIYLPAFERVVREEQPATVMCAYNRVNGVYGSENRRLLTNVLRGEWGFEGAVVSDWGAVHTPELSVAAGLDLEMPGTNGRSQQRLVDAVNEGRLSVEDVDTAVARVIKLTNLGGAPREPFDVNAHHELARELAAQCAVLLKNSDALPLEHNGAIAVIGEFAQTPRFQGGGSSHVNATRVVSFLDALTAYPNAQVQYEPGVVSGATFEDGEQHLRRAVSAAATADVALVFAGLSEEDESEGFDRDTLDLPADQVRLINAVAEVAQKTVVILSNGGVVTVDPWCDNVDAILETFLLGQASGSAVADLLFGQVSPSGRLAESIPYRLQDSPSYLGFPGERGQVIYGERMFVGYRGHTTSQRPARYPFGHGLSYTSFKATGFSAVSDGADTAVVELTLTNTGDRAGAHVVQVYVDARACGDVVRPTRELRAFEKVYLAAGQSKVVQLRLDRRAFAFWDVELDEWVVSPGEYRVQLGHNADDIACETTVELEGDHIVRELSLESTVEEWFGHPLVAEQLFTAVNSPMIAALRQPEMLRMLGSLPMRKIVGVLGSALPPGLLTELAEQTAEAALASRAALSTV